MQKIGRKILNLRPLIRVYFAFGTVLMAERDRWAMWLPVMLGAGIGFYFWLPFEPPLWTGGLVFGAFGGVAWFWRKQPGTKAMVMLAIAFIGLGAGIAGLRTRIVQAPVLETDIGPVQIEGQVLKLETRPKGMRVTLGHLNIERLAPKITPYKVRVTLSANQPSIKPGDWVRMLVKLAPPPPPAVPNAFDFQRQSFFKGLGGVGFAFGRSDVIRRETQHGFANLTFVLQKIRQTIGQKVIRAMSAPNGAVAAALMTGDRSAIPKAVIGNMRASGLAHLLAISGLHVGLIAGIIFFAVRAVLALIEPVALRYPIKKWAAVAAFVGAGSYALLAGATVPTQRAFFMIGLVLMAVVFDRRALSMRMVAWAAFVILMMAPESVLGASFQLSFSAVVALIAVYENLRGAQILKQDSGNWGHKVGRYVLGVAVTTLVAGLATAVFAAYHFNQVSIFSLAANVLAVPITALWVMPWAVVSYVLMPFGLENWSLAAMEIGVDAVLNIAKTVAHWPGAIRYVPAFPLWGLVLFTFGGLWIGIWQGRWRVMGIPVMGLGFTAFFFVTSPDVIIDRTGKLAAIKTPIGGYLVSTLSSKKFDRAVWLRRAGLIKPEGLWGKSKSESPRTKIIQPMPRSQLKTLSHPQLKSQPQLQLNSHIKPQFKIKSLTPFLPQSTYLRCDGLGCVFQPYVNKENKGHSGQGNIGDISIAFVKKPEALQEDCRQNQVVVVLNNFGSSIPNCAAKLFIGFDDLKNKGAHALYFERKGRGIRVETVQGSRGVRPWVLRQ